MFRYTTTYLMTTIIKNVYNGYSYLQCDVVCKTGNVTVSAKYRRETLNLVNHNGEKCQIYHNSSIIVKPTNTEIRIRGPFIESQPRIRAGNMIIIKIVNNTTMKTSYFKIPAPSTCAKSSEVYTEDDQDDLPIDAESNDIKLENTKQTLEQPNTDQIPESESTEQSHDHQAPKSDSTFVSDNQKTYKRMRDDLVDEIKKLEDTIVAKRTKFDITKKILKNLAEQSDLVAAFEILNK